MLLFLSITGIILSVILISFNIKSCKSAIYLGGFFFMVSLYAFTQYVIFYSGSAFLVSIFFLNTAFLSYLTGPLLYWYVRGVLADHSRLEKKDLWHLAPALIFFISALPYTFTPYSYKLLVANDIIENIGNLGKFKDTLLSQVFPNAAIYLSRPILVMGYALWSAGIFISHLFQKRESSVLSRQKYMTQWIKVLLGFLVILVVSHILILAEAFADKDKTLFFTLNILQIISAVGLAGLLISPFFFPGILYGLPRLPEPILVQQVKDRELDNGPREIKKYALHFESEYLLSIDHKIDSCMKKFHPYLQPEFNLASVSKCIEVPMHHLAYYFRVVKKQSFSDYRNELRISHAKQLIREGKAKELTLEGIAMQSGFSTRNTFFTAFKKVEGVSPGVYSSQSPD
jgi:AraC-like DNA-binding protein